MARLRDYIFAAFSARPRGVPIPPNWVGLAAFGLLGAVNPGFWLIGAGLEAAYLLACAMSPRFRKLIDAKERLRTAETSDQKIRRILARLAASERQRFHDLDARCRSVLSDVRSAGSQALADAQAESLAGFRWAYLQLLVMRSGVHRMLESANESGRNAAGLLDRIEELSQRLKAESLPSDLRESLESQREVLSRRLETQTVGREKVEHIESELERIENHVELVREQALVTGNPEDAKYRIDQAASTLDSTTKWIQEQSSLNDTVAGLIAEPPPVIAEEQAEQERA